MDKNINEEVENTSSVSNKIFSFGKARNSESLEFKVKEDNEKPIKDEKVIRRLKKIRFGLSQKSKELPNKDEEINLEELPFYADGDDEFNHQIQYFNNLNSDTEYDIEEVLDSIPDSYIDDVLKRLGFYELYSPWYYPNASYKINSYMMENISKSTQDILDCNKRLNYLDAIALYKRVSNNCSFSLKFCEPYADREDYSTVELEYRKDGLYCTYTPRVGNINKLIISANCLVDIIASKQFLEELIKEVLEDNKLIWNNDQVWSDFWYLSIYQYRKICKLNINFDEIKEDNVITSIMCRWFPNQVKQLCVPYPNS